MKLPAFFSKREVTISVGWLYIAALVEFVQLVLIFGR